PKFGLPHRWPILSSIISGSGASKPINSDSGVWGFLTTDAFRYFLRSRHYEWIADKPVEQTTYHEAWNKIKNWAASDFLKCMEDVFAGKVDEAMKTYRQGTS
ncbi:MAG: hypothetical protein M3463_16945, partial [Verrucomicrobiota bacterium]|nr:hypothetical protein [Verrucomicrobiota bacterium]